MEAPMGKVFMHPDPHTHSMKESSFTPLRILNLRGHHLPTTLVKIPLIYKGSPLVSTNLVLEWIPLKILAPLSPLAPHNPLASLTQELHSKGSSLLQIIRGCPLTECLRTPQLIIFLHTPTSPHSNGDPLLIISPLTNEVILLILSLIGATNSNREDTTSRCLAMSAMSRTAILATDGGVGEKEGRETGTGKETETGRGRGRGRGRGETERGKGVIERGLPSTTEEVEMAHQLPRGPEVTGRAPNMAEERRGNSCGLKVNIVNKLNKN